MEDDGVSVRKLETSTDNSQRARVYMSNWALPVLAGYLPWHGAFSPCRWTTFKDRPSVRLH